LVTPLKITGGARAPLPPADRPSAPHSPRPALAARLGRRDDGRAEPTNGL